jgi:hypothetical protein
MLTTRTRTALAAAAAVPLIAALVTPAAAEPTEVYRGHFTGITSEDCTPAAPDWQVSGGWRFVDRGEMATVSFTIFLDGKHHVSFGGPVEQSGELTVAFPTGAGNLTVSVDPAAGEMQYAFLDGYTALDGSFTCASLVYHGTVD